MIRVLIADDQALVRGGFRMILDAQADMDVDGLEATRRLLRTDAPPRVLILTRSTSTSTSTRR